MIRALRILFLWIPAALALLPAYMVLRLWIDWQANCAGGRAVNPGYHVADCWDSERAILMLIVVAAILALPAAAYGLFRGLARRRARHGTGAESGAGSGAQQP